ncbi:MAG: O-antigen ligase family protein [Brumimicrobium sp.]|nr:O-antigen ligase family protein [Brumimicrobium sp.]
MQINKNIFARNTLFILIVAYFLQGSVYESGSIISQVSLLVILFISLYYFIRLLFSNEKKNNIFILWSSLVFLNLIGFLFTGDIMNKVHFSMLKVVMMALLSFYPFYYFSSRNLISERYILIFGLVMLPVIVLEFYFNHDLVLERFGKENVVNNVGYSFVSIIPFLFFHKKSKIIPLLILLICLYFIVESTKRGAILIGIISALLYLYYLIRSQRKNNFFSYILILIGIISIYYFLSNLIENDSFLLQRIEQTKEGDSSQRNIIYYNIWNGWLNSDNFLHLLLGFGFAGSTILSGMGLAHNDWLELLSNFGLLGVSIYLFLFIYLFKFIILYKGSFMLKMLGYTLIITWIIKTLFSMGIYTESFIFQSMLIAYLIGRK